MTSGRKWASSGHLRWPVAVLLALALVGLVPAASSALPTASFVFAPTDPVAGDPVTFDFTGTCDEPPCRIRWRWFQDGGSSLGTSMGEGEHIQYAFDRAGSYTVVVKITNALSTHGSATATRVVMVAEPPATVIQDRGRAVELDGWKGRASALASSGGYRVGHATAGLSVARGRVSYVAMTGPDLGRARVSVDGTVVRRVDLRSAAPARRSWTFRLPPGAGGPHRVRVRPAGWRAISLDGFVLRRPASTTRVDDTSTRVSYGAWAGSHVAGAAGGTVRSSSSSGAVARVAFTGTSLTWVTLVGPDQGLARVEVDGTRLATVDNWSATRASSVERTFGGLGAGRHVVTLVVLPRSGDHAESLQVTVDAFVVR